jgi:hypothetical protein
MVPLRLFSDGLRAIDPGASDEAWARAVAKLLLSVPGHAWPPGSHDLTGRLERPHGQVELLAWLLSGHRFSVKGHGPSWSMFGTLADMRQIAAGARPKGCDDYFLMTPEGELSRDGKGTLQRVRTYKPAFAEDERDRERALVGRMFGKMRQIIFGSRKPLSSKEAMRRYHADRNKIALLEEMIEQGYEGYSLDPLQVPGMLGRDVLHEIFNMAEDLDIDPKECGAALERVDARIFARSQRI